MEELLGCRPLTLLTKHKLPVQLAATDTNNNCHQSDRCVGVGLFHIMFSVAHTNEAHSQQ